MNYLHILGGIAFNWFDSFLDTFALSVAAPLLLLVSVYFSWKIRWPQFTKFREGLRYIVSRTDKEKKMSSFAAVATIIGGNLGTGTIVGTAIAVSTGGPGAIIWMMVVAILCSVIKLCCSSLGVLFDEEQNGGRRIGGPMFYISKGLHSKVLATTYSIVLVGAAITVGNLVQVNSFVTSFGKDFQYKWVLIAMLAIPVAFILFGGLKRFAKFMSCIVPIMGVIYMIACVIGIFNLRSNFPSAIKQIMLGAVGINSIVGGTFGFILSNAISSGIRRGLFATDIGLGLAGIAHSNVDSHVDDSALHAKQQGIVALIAPIFVAGICAVTGTLIVCAEPNMALDGSKICTSTFNKAFGTEHAEIFVQTIVYCFALTTILAWAWFAEHSFYFVRKGRLCTLFKIATVLIIPIGVLMDSKLPWKLADFFVDGLLLTNVVSIFLLRKHVLQLMSPNKQEI